MRLVTIAPFRITPPDNGGRQVIFGASREYALRCEAFACLAVTTLRARGPLPPTPFAYREFPSPASVLQGFDRLRLFPTTLYHRAMRRHAAALARAAWEYRPDVVEVHLPWLAAVRRFLPSSVKVVLIMQNVETIWQDASIRRRLFPGFFRRMLRGIEDEAVRLADHVLCLTPQDRETLVRTYGLPAGKVSAIPPGADLQEAPPSAPARVGRAPRGIFVGSAFSENHAAARRLLDIVVPGLDAGTEVLIAGDVCRGLRGLPVPPSVKRLGRVADLGAVLRTCDALLNPSALRTGIHIKIIEALAAGCRVITTPDGARGYEDLAGGPIVIAAPESFAACLRTATRLVPGEWSRVRALAWPEIVRRRFDLYSRIGAPL